MASATLEPIASSRQEYGHQELPLVLAGQGALPVKACLAPGVAALFDGFPRSSSDGVE